MGVGGWGGHLRTIWDIAQVPIPGESFWLKASFKVYFSKFQGGYSYFMIPVLPHWRVCFNISSHHGGVTWEQFETHPRYPIQGESCWLIEGCVVYISDFQEGMANLQYQYPNTGDCVGSISSHYQGGGGLPGNNFRHFAGTLSQQKAFLTKGHFYYIFIISKVGVCIFHAPLVHPYWLLCCKYLFISSRGVIWKQFDIFPRYPFQGERFWMSSRFILYF